MPKVFIVNEPNKTSSFVRANYDVTPALQFGEIEFVFPHDKFYRPTPSDNIARAVAHAWKVLAKFNPATDYIVWAGGDPISMLIVAPILFEIADTRPIKYLKFERAREVDSGEKKGTGFYVERTVELFDTSETEEDDD